MALGVLKKSEPLSVLKNFVRVTSVGRKRYVALILSSVESIWLARVSIYLSRAALVVADATG